MPPVFFTFSRVLRRAWRLDLTASGILHFIVSVLRRAWRLDLTDTSPYSETPLPEEPARYASHSPRSGPVLTTVPPLRAGGSGGGERVEGDVGSAPPPPPCAGGGGGHAA
eukprot:5280180-Pyramimonas_sp.AAC.1